MANAPNAQDPEKPDLDEPVKITNLNQAVAVINKRTDKTYKRAAMFAKFSAIGGGVAAVIVAFSAVPTASMAFVAVTAAVAGFEISRDYALRDVRRELQRNEGDYKDEIIRPRALSAPDLAQPVRVSGLNKAVAMIDRKKNKAFKNFNTFKNVALAGAALTVGAAVFGFSPIFMGAMTVIAASAAAHHLIRGTTLGNFARKFNAAAAPAPQAKNAVAPKNAAGRLKDLGQKFKAKI